MQWAVQLFPLSTRCRQKPDELYYHRGQRMAFPRFPGCAPQQLPMFHLVLHEPEIPPNTGNLIRLAANTGCVLHLVKPLGFQLDRKSVRRAGLDYDELATVRVHDSFAAARAALASGRWFAIETGSARRHVDARFSPGDVLLFGSERRGLPPEILALIDADCVLSLPMLAGNRSLNLSNAAAVAVYEAWRQQDFAGAGPLS